MSPRPNPHRPVRWFVYDAAGAITRTGQCSDRAVDAQALEPGETIVRLPPGAAVPDGRSHRVDLSDPARPRVVPIGS